MRAQEKLTDDFQGDVYPCSDVENNTDPEEMFTVGTFMQRSLLLRGE